MLTEANPPVTDPRIPLSEALEKLLPRDERRRAQRSGFAYRMLLTPLDGVEPIAEPIYVTGRDLSARGVGFEHSEPIEHRKVRLAAADDVLEELGFADLEIDLVLKWCHFVSQGLYVSGGRVTRTTAPLF